MLINYSCRRKQFTKKQGALAHTHIHERSQRINELKYFSACFILNHSLFFELSRHFVFIRKRFIWKWIQTKYCAIYIYLYGSLIERQIHIRTHIHTQFLHFIFWFFEEKEKKDSIANVSSGIGRRQRDEEEKKYLYWSVFVCKVCVCARKWCAYLFGDEQSQHKFHNFFWPKNNVKTSFDQLLKHL